MKTYYVTWEHFGTDGSKMVLTREFDVAEEVTSKENVKPLQEALVHRYGAVVIGERPRILHFSEKRDDFTALEYFCEIYKDDIVLCLVGTYVYEGVVNDLVGFVCDGDEMEVDIQIGEVNRIFHQSSVIQVRRPVSVQPRKSDVPKEVAEV